MHSSLCSTKHTDYHLGRCNNIQNSNMDVSNLDVNVFFFWWYLIVWIMVFGLVRNERIIWNDNCFILRQYEYEQLLSLAIIEFEKKNTN